MLFDSENGEVVISPQAKQLAPFRAIWTRDRDKAKIVALKELAYVYYMADYRSPYFNLPSEDREALIVRSLFKEEKDPRLERVREWKPDNIIQEAIVFYKVLCQTPTMRLLEQTKNSILDSDRLVSISRRRMHALMDRLDTMDAIEEVDEISKVGIQAVNTFKNIINIAETIPDVHKTLNAVEDMIKKEISGSSRVKGGGALNPREM